MNDGLSRQLGGNSFRFQLARVHRPEVVLCDIGLPSGMDGYEVAKAFRADAELRAVFLVP